MISCFISDSPWFVGAMDDAQRAVLEGGNITLMCATSVDGNPPPTISWMDNNGTTVSDGTGISGSTTLSLTITGITRYQAGNWTCAVENSPGGGTPCSVQRQIMMRVVGEYVLIHCFVWAVNESRCASCEHSSLPVLQTCMSIKYVQEVLTSIIKERYSK